MKNLEETKEKIKTYIEESSFSSEKIDYSTKIFDQGLLDSMGLLFLIEFLNENFGIEVDDFELNPENFGTVNDIANFVKSKGEI